MNYADRFLIGVIASAAAVTFYTTPQEIVTKIWIVPAAVTAVLFPRIAEAGIARFRDRMRHTIWQSIATMVVFIYPPLLIMVLFAKKILSLWISPDFAAQSYFLLQYFAIGMLVNVPANIPFTILQGVGRAKSVALVHLVELPLSLTLTWWLVSEFSLAGAGLSWLLRCVVDTMLMFWLARKLIFGSKISFTGPGFSIRMLTAILGLIPFVAILTPNLFIKGLFSTTGIVVCAFAGYKIWVNRTRPENVNI
jgi:O-antigen/teichoic acid export membrane protein